MVRLPPPLSQEEVRAKDAKYKFEDVREKQKEILQLDQSIEARLKAFLPKS